MKDLKYVIVFCLLYCLSISSAISQTTSNVVVIESGMPLNNIGIIGKEVPKGNLKGSQYLFDNWMVADVLINDQRILKDIEINIDLLRDEVDILIEGNRKVLPKSIVSNFKLVGSNLIYYWNRIDDEEVLVVELVEGNSYDLLEQIYLIVKEPTYNVALDMGSRDTEIVKRNTFWVRNNDGAISEISNSGKKNLKIFENSDDLKNFIKDNQLSWKDREDLVLIVHQANLKQD